MLQPLFPRKTCISTPLLYGLNKFKYFLKRKLSLENYFFSSVLQHISSKPIHYRSTLNFESTLLLLHFYTYLGNGVACIYIMKGTLIWKFQKKQQKSFCAISHITSKNYPFTWAANGASSTKLSLLRENDLVTSIQSYSKLCFGSTQL